MSVIIAYPSPTVTAGRHGGYPTSVISTGQQSREKFTQRITINEKSRSKRKNEARFSGKSGRAANASFFKTYSLFFFFFRERLVSLARSRDRTALPGIGSRNNFARNGRCCQRRRDNSSRGEDGGVPRSFRSIVNYSRKQGLPAAAQRVRGMSNCLHLVLLIIMH